jgi:hypothetical protein
VRNILNAEVSIRPPRAAESRHYTVIHQPQQP